jgi:hypothetical protein
MPGVHRYPPISYRPSNALRARLVAYAAERGQTVNSILTEALTRFLDEAEQAGGDGPARPWS